MNASPDPSLKIEINKVIDLSSQVNENQEISDLPSNMPYQTRKKKKGAGQWYWKQIKPTLYNRDILLFDTQPPN